MADFNSYYGKNRFEIENFLLYVKNRLLQSEFRRFSTIFRTLAQTAHSGPEGSKNYL